MGSHVRRHVGHQRRPLPQRPAEPLALSKPTGKGQRAGGNQKQAENQEEVEGGEEEPECGVAAPPFALGSTSHAQK